MKYECVAVVRTGPSGRGGFGPSPALPRSGDYATDFARLSYILLLFFL